MKDKGIITEEQMVEALLRSGYPLEQRVEAVLEEAGYYVVANAAYPDPTTGKSREIDIEAITVRQIYKKKAEPRDFFSMPDL